VTASLERAADGQRIEVPTRHVPGEEGVWVLIFGDMLLFAVVFSTYLYYRARDPGLFAASQQTLDNNLGVANTLLLLTSSLCVSIGVRALRQQAGATARAMFAAALLCGFGFSLVKAVEWGSKLQIGITPGTNDFFMYYFVLTGLHFFHVLLGMGVLGFLLSQSRARHLTDTRFALVEGGACFWHLVDLLWIVLFPLLYLVR
jgi:nitric oxide reductase NorE protein